MILGFFKPSFWLFEAVNRFIKVSRVPLRCFWVKNVLKNKFLGMKYPCQDFLVTLWSSKSRPVDNVFLFLFFLDKQWTTHRPLYDKKNA